MLLQDYQELAMRTCSCLENKKDMLIHGTVGYVSEIDELLEAINESEEHTKKELGDCFWMLAEICSSQNILFAQVLNEAKMYSKSNSAKLCEMVQKTYQGHEIEYEKIYFALCGNAKELISVVDELGFSVIEILEMNIEKLKARYPEGFESEKSLNRAEGDI